MKNLIGFIAISTVCLFSWSCETGIELGTQEGIVMGISAPDTVRLGQTASIKVTFLGQNGCSRTSHVTLDKKGKFNNARGFYTHPEDSKVSCTMEIPSFEETVLLEATKLDTMYIRAANNPLIFDYMIVLP